jgi:hypothetical protein
VHFPADLSFLQPEGHCHRYDQKALFSVEKRGQLRSPARLMAARARVRIPEDVERSLICWHPVARAGRESGSIGISTPMGGRLLFTVKPIHPDSGAFVTVQRTTES